MEILFSKYATGQLELFNIFFAHCTFYYSSYLSFSYCIVGFNNNMLMIKDNFDTPYKYYSGIKSCI